MVIFHLVLLVISNHLSPYDALFFHGGIIHMDLLRQLLASPTATTWAVLVSLGANIDEKGMMDPTTLINRVFPEEYDVTIERTIETVQPALQAHPMGAEVKLLGTLTALILIIAIYFLYPKTPLIKSSEIIG
ncbi:hypothetical protein SCP_1602300 [Sparassis crispa]|uniref:Uncharacterized protein n=1 Tax=Sparassis crispa TaxID=139825 RepID=A0A401H557_9APHY|nr:hypothetical protein SCP_1602300 [Sparassis crispa]GBE89568.1 hypothetical protein SCP_1602300 [Sparassis crispa]